MDHVLFPRFWIEEPALWFAQIEAVFALNSITSETDKYDYILCELPSTAISLIKDLILDSNMQHKDDKYQRVKEELITRISINDLSKEEIESKKPSEFLKYLKEKADPLVPEEAVKEVWLKKLPEHVNYIVSDLKGDLESVCKLADTIKEYIPLPCQNLKLDKKSEGIGSDGDADDVPKILQNLGTRLESIQSELFKFQLIYRENNTHLESIQAELQKFKLMYNENNTRLETIQSEIQKIKLACGSENNDMIFLCKKCEKEKSTTKDKPNGSSVEPNENSENDESNEESENDKSVSSKDEKPEEEIPSKEVEKDNFCWKHATYGDNAHCCYPPCNYIERKAAKKKLGSA